MNNSVAAGLAAKMAPEAGVENNARSWTKVLAQYRRPNTARSTIEIVVTVLPFVLLWVVASLAVVNGIWWGLLLTIPAAGFLVRLFALQHDCGHGALFSRRGANDWTGRAIGVLTFTPYDYWRRTHAIHHASAGNLGERGTGDIETLTVREYRALPWLAIGGEVAWSSVPDALGAGGVSAVFGEDNLGGTTIRIKATFGR